MPASLKIKDNRYVMATIPDLTGVRAAVRFSTLPGVPVYTKKFLLNLILTNPTYYGQHCAAICDVSR